jgi:hypothetical protein
MNAFKPKPDALDEAAGFPIGFLDDRGYATDAKLSEWEIEQGPQYTALAPPGGRGRNVHPDIVARVVPVQYNSMQLLSIDHRNSLVALDRFKIGQMGADQIGDLRQEGIQRIPAQRAHQTMPPTENRKSMDRSETCSSFD